MRRRVLLSDIDGSVVTPSATYTRLTHIETTGVQYFDLGYVVQENDVIEMDYISTSNTSADKMLFGATGGTGLWFSVYSSVAYARFGYSSSTSVSNVQSRYSVKLEKGKVSLDGTATTLSYDSMPNNTLFIFSNHLSTGGASSAMAKCKTSYFKISNNNVVIYDLRPVKRDSDGKIGMLDFISGTFFINEGSGDDFIGGSEIKITPDYELLEYVTFTKDKLFDIGVIKSTYTIDVKFKRSESSTTPYLYGIVTSPHTASVTAYLSSGGAWRFGTSYTGLSMNNTATHHVEISNGKAVYDFTSKTFTKATFTTPDTAVLGGYRAASGSLTTNYQGRVYFFRIFEGSTLILDYYPCKRLSDGVEGFWDCVSQTFINKL